MRTPLPAAGPQDLGRLRWRCRRGMKELDVLLARYLDRHFCRAPIGEQEAFRQLLETQDPILHAYCLGSEPPPPQFAALIERITADRPADRPADRGPAGHGNSPADR
jgi:antitoxin CptB